MQIDDEFIQLTDRTGESKLHAAEVEKIIETGSYFYLIFKTGEYLNIPKSAIQNSSKVREQLNAFCSTFKIPYTPETGWKWK